MFTHPFLLWGLFFVLLPLVIHLINLLRHRPVEWGAMEFLLAAYRKHRTRMRMRELLLLLMRMILVALIVLMLAGPVVHSVLPGGAKTHHIVILDDSFSMSDRLGETSVFENAKISVQKLVDGLERQSAIHNFTLLRTSQARHDVRKADVHEQRIGPGFREILALDAMKASHSAGNLLDALEYASELAPEPSNGNRILYIISDFRTRDWKENPALMKRLDALTRDGFRLRFVDCAPAEHPNLGISALKPEEGVRAAGVPLVMSVRITNFGTSAVENVVIHPEIFAENKKGTGQNSKSHTSSGEKGGNHAEPGSAAESSSESSAENVSENVAENSTENITRNAAERNAEQDAGSPPTSRSLQTVPTVTIPEIPAGETVVGKFPVTFPSEGDYTVKVTLAPDSVADDNQVFAALNVPPFEPVLIIDDSLDGSSSRFLRTALAPGDRVETGITPRVEKARFLSTNALSAFRSIYLLDTASLEPQAVTALDEFLKNGGGLCIFTGPHTDPLMAQKWYRGGKGFFPVILDQTQELPPYYAAPDVRVSPHPIFRVFSGDHAAQFNTIHVERYYTLDDTSLETLIPLEDETAQAQKSRRNRKKDTRFSENTAENTASSGSSSDSDTKSGSSTELNPEPDSTGDSDVHIIAALRNNAPLVVERTYGRGKVVLFLTSADREWTDWPVGNPSHPNPFAQGSYVIMALQLQAYLTRRPLESFQVGEALSASFPAESFESAVRFLNPDASVWKVLNAAARKDGTLQAQSPPAQSPGVFQAELTGRTGLRESRFFAVNVDVREGDTVKITREALAAGMHEIPFEMNSAEEFRFAASDTAASALSDWILAFILLWMVLEMLLAASASCHLSGNSAESKAGFKKEKKERIRKTGANVRMGGEK